MYAAVMVKGAVRIADAAMLYDSENNNAV